jgi:hypothetical protein
MWTEGIYPMVSLPFLDWFDSYDFSEFNMLELGAGGSTHYFSKKTKTYVSLETNVDYYENLTPVYNNTNVTLKFVSEEDLNAGNYSIAINEKTIVFIDSDGNRLKQTKNLMAKGKPNIIIVDNSEWFPNQCQYIYNQGYTEIPFWGIRFEEYFDKCTSVFIKNGFSFPEKNYAFFCPGSQIVNKEHNDTD